MQSDPVNMYTMFDLKILDENIWYYENVISYPEDLINFINKMDDDETSYSRIPKWSNWTASNDESMIYGKTKMIHQNAFEISSGNERVDQTTLYILNSLKMAVELSAKDFVKRRQLDVSEININLDQVNIKMYYADQEMGPHYDGQDGDTKLRYSIITYLNDDYEGGELYFPLQGVQFKPKKGAAYFFPGDKNYIHGVTEIKSGLRFTCPFFWEIVHHTGDRKP